MDKQLNLTIKIPIHKDLPIIPALPSNKILPNTPKLTSNKSLPSIPKVTRKSALRSKSRFYDSYDPFHLKINKMTKMEPWRWAVLNSKGCKTDLQSS
jgi:hypothetical protein